MVERKRIEREAPTSFYDLWRSIARFSSCQELKSIYVTRATQGYQKHGISPKIQARSFWKSKVLGLGSVHGTS